MGDVGRVDPPCSPTKITMLHLHCKVAFERESSFMAVFVESSFEREPSFMAAFVILAASNCGYFFSESESKLI